MIIEATIAVSDNMHYCRCIPGCMPPDATVAVVTMVAAPIAASATAIGRIRLPGSDMTDHCRSVSICSRGGRCRVACSRQPTMVIKGCGTPGRRDLADRLFVGTGSIRLPTASGIAGTLPPCLGPGDEQVVKGACGILLRRARRGWRKAAVCWWRGSVGDMLVSA